MQYTQYFDIVGNIFEQFGNRISFNILTTIKKKYRTIKKNTENFTNHHKICFSKSIIYHSTKVVDTFQFSPSKSLVK